MFFVSGLSFYLGEVDSHLLHLSGREWHQGSVNTHCECSP